MQSRRIWWPIPPRPRGLYRAESAGRPVNRPGGKATHLAATKNRAGSDLVQAMPLQEQVSPQAAEAEELAHRAGAIAAAERAASLLEQSIAGELAYQRALTTRSSPSFFPPATPFCPQLPRPGRKLIPRTAAKSRARTTVGSGKPTSRNDQQSIDASKPSANFSLKPDSSSKGFSRADQRLKIPLPQHPRFPNQGTLHMTKLVDLLDSLKYRRTFGFMDDFDAYSSGGRWTSVLNNSGTASVGDVTGGVLSLRSQRRLARAQSDEKLSPQHQRHLHCSTRTSRSSSMAASQILLEAERQQHSEHYRRADEWRGRRSRWSTAAPGPKDLQYSGMTFFKQGGTNIWSCQTSLGSSQTTLRPLRLTAASGSSYHTLTGQWQPINTTQAEGRFFIDGLLVANQLFTFTSGVQMQLMAGVKNGSSSKETLPDQLFGRSYQLR